MAHLINNILSNQTRAHALDFLTLSLQGIFRFRDLVIIQNYPIIGLQASVCSDKLKLHAYTLKSLLDWPVY